MIVSCFKTLGANKLTGRLDLNYLLKNLLERGEKFTQQELDECFQALLGNTVDFREKLQNSQYITAKQFAEDILGFEDYQELEGTETTE
jgi:hypothetical protein